jgi:two-component system chemotaxis response regulator CheY
MRKKVMIIDDSSTIRIYAGASLTQAGFEVIEASDGVEGAQKIDAIADLSLIICDIHMPRMSGIQMVELLQRAGRKVPVIVLTSEVGIRQKDRARMAGVRAWINKPFEPATLVRVALELTQPRPPSQPPSAEPTPPVTETRTLS